MIETKVVIIGTGPSGITAAIYLKRSNIPFILIEKYMVGGKLATTSYIENYPGFNKEDGVDFALKLQNQLDYNNIQITYDNIVELTKKGDYFFSKSDTEIYKSEYVIVASGTKEKKLNLKNEEKYYSRGISFCAICDGALYKNKDVAVIGGGNSALEEAIYLSSITNKVHLIHRRHEFRAQKMLVEKVLNKDNIEIHTPYSIKNYFGKQNIEGIEVENLESKETKIINVEGVFVYIGLEPNSDFIKIDINNDKGFIITNNSMESSIENLYAIGDIRNKKLRQVVTATNDGAIAAIEIQNKEKSK